MLELPGQGEQGADTLGEVVLLRAVVDPELCLLVAECLARLDDRLGEAHIHNVGVGRQLPEDGEGVAFDIRFERAQVCAQEHRKHVDALVHQIHGRAADAGLGIHGIVGFDKVGDVGDVHADLDVAVWKRPGMEGVVDVLAADRVDAADEEAAEILSAHPTRIVHALRNFPAVAFLRQAVEDGLGERPVLDIVLEKQGFRLGRLGFQLTQRSYKVARRMAGAAIPPVDGDEDPLPDKLGHLAGA